MAGFEATHNGVPVGQSPLNGAGGDLSGSAGAGYIGFPAQASAPAVPASGFRLFANSLGKLAWKGANGFLRIFDGTANTADRTYTLPDVTGIVRVLAYSGTWASKPAANSLSAGTRIWVTDVGPDGSEWQTNGTRWVPVNGRVVLARGASAVSVTGTTSETMLATVIVPAGAMGVNGQLHIKTLWSHTNSANNKSLRVRLGGTAAFLASGATTTASAQADTVIRNRNASNSQVAFPSQITSTYGGSGNAVVTSSIDTTTDQNITITGQLANTGETITLEGYSVELIG